MKRHLLLIVWNLFLLIPAHATHTASLLATINAPMLISPQEGSTIDVGGNFQFNFLTIQARTNDAQAYSLVLSVRIKNTDEEVFSQVVSGIASASQEVAFQVGVSPGFNPASRFFNGGDDYALVLTSYTVAGMKVASRSFTIHVAPNTLYPAEYLLPAPNATINVGSSGMAIQAYTSHPLADKLYYKVYSVRTGQLVLQHTFAPFVAPAPMLKEASLLAPNEQYQVEVTTVTARGHILKRSSYTFSTGALVRGTPALKLLSPAPYTVLDNWGGSVQFQALLNDVNARNLHFKLMVNDPRSLVLQDQSVIPLSTDTAATQMAFQIDGTRLKPNEQYLVELKLTDGSGAFLKQLYFTFFTGQPGSLVPKVVSPAATARWYFCEDQRRRSLGIFVCNANDARTRKLKVTIRDKATGQIVGQAFNGAFGVPIEFTMPHAQAALQDHRATVIYTGGDTTAVSVELVNLDSAGTVIGQATYTQQPYRLKINRILNPDFIYPTDGATHISTQPLIQITRPTEPADVPCKYTFVFTSYEIDRYPADWSGDDYQIFSKNISDTNAVWTPPVALQAHTQYQVRVGYVTVGSQLPVLYKTISFTTGTSAATRLITQGERTRNPTEVWPNPFDQELAVKVAPSFAQTQVRVFGQDGRVVFEKQATGGKTLSLQTLQLPAGIYVIQLHDNEGRHEQLKVVKQ